MAVIDADAHVLETEHTWDYMLESERALQTADRADAQRPELGRRVLVDRWHLSRQSAQRRRGYLP